MENAGVGYRSAQRRAIRSRRTGVLCEKEKGDDEGCQASVRSFCCARPAVWTTLTNRTNDHLVQSGRIRITRRASVAATSATQSAVARSAHHHPRSCSAKSPNRANSPKAAPMALNVPSPINAWLPSRLPVRYFAHPRGASTTAEAPAEIIAKSECSGTECERRFWIAATVRVIATRLRPVATTIEARASA